MRKVFLVVATLVVAGLVFSQGPSPNTTQHRVKTAGEIEAKQDRRDQQQTTQTPARPARVIPGKTGRRETGDGNTTSNETQSYEDDSIRYATWVIAGAAIVQIIVMIVAACQMRRYLELTKQAAEAAKASADTARDTLIQSNRPWVQALVEGFHGEDADKDAGADIVLCNIGHGVAQIKAIGLRLTIEYMPSPWAFEAMPVDFPLMAGAKQPQTITCSYNRLMMEELNNRSSFPHVMGIVAYEDGFGHSRKTQFCLQRRDGNLWIPVSPVGESYNSAD